MARERANENGIYEVKKYLVRCRRKTSWRLSTADNSDSSSSAYKLIAAPKRYLCVLNSRRKTFSETTSTTTTTTTTRKTRTARRWKHTSERRKFVSLVLFHLQHEWEMIANRILSFSKSRRRRRLQVTKESLRRMKYPNENQVPASKNKLCEKRKREKRKTKNFMIYVITTKASFPSSVLFVLAWYSLLSLFFKEEGFSAEKDDNLRGKMKMVLEKAWWGWRL